MIFFFIGKYDISFSLPKNDEFDIYQTMAYSLCGSVQISPLVISVGDSCEYYQGEMGHAKHAWQCLFDSNLSQIETLLNTN